MNIYSILQLCGGLAFFLFGMHVMSGSLEKLAGGNLQKILKEVTSNPIKSLFFGAIVTIAIQSSSALTVMLVGLVNSGIMELAQTVGVIMGSNIGTTLTAWILSLSGIESDNLFISMLKPENFSPIIALIGVIMIMGSKKEKRKDVGIIMAGFAVLMYGMQLMSGAVSPLADMPEFTGLLTTFNNPFLGVLVGAVFTGVIQSSAASVGVLQALAMTGAISYGMAIPIIMGQNIGTCVTALISSVGTQKNAKRAAVVHLMFNVIGVVVLLTAFWIVKIVFAPAILDENATMSGIAIAHSLFNILCTAMLLPAGGLLEKLAIRIVPDKGGKEQPVELEERLLITPSVALGRCRAVAGEMARCAGEALHMALTTFENYSPELAESIRENESRCDRYEDELGTYLVRLSAQQLSDAESEEATELLKIIGDFERISDHAVNLLAASEELRSKGLGFSATAEKELKVLIGAVSEILNTAERAFSEKDLAAAAQVEPLKQVIVALKEQMRTRHILRMQQGHCSIEAGFVWSDLLTDLERTADHCSNIAGCVLDAANHGLNLHETLRAMRADDPDFRRAYGTYAEKYRLQAV